MRYPCEWPSGQVVDPVTPRRVSVDWLMSYKADSDLKQLIFDPLSTRNRTINLRSPSIRNDGRTERGYLPLYAGQAYVGYGLPIAASSHSASCQLIQSWLSITLLAVAVICLARNPRNLHCMMEAALSQSIIDSSAYSVKINACCINFRVMCPRYALWIVTANGARCAFFCSIVSWISRCTDIAAIQSYHGIDLLDERRVWNEYGEWCLFSSFTESSCK